jgi:flagellar hook-associated protein 1 FlgK
MYNIELLHNGTSEILLVNGIDSYQINIEPPNNAYWAITGKGTTGELHSLYMAYDGTVNGQQKGIIPQYMTQLEDMFNTLVDKINEIHKQGYPLIPMVDSDSTTQGMDIDFFVVGSGNPFDSVSVNPDIVKDLRLIAASNAYYEIDDNGQTKQVGYPGNGANALAISQLRDMKLDIGNNFNGTFDDYYRSILGKLGVQTQEAQRQTNNTQLILDSVDYRRQSVSGVSLDEEMANLVQLQHAYNSSARMVTTVDQMLDTIINRMGVVGR